MKTENTLEPLLVGKKQGRDLLGVSIRTIEYAIANGTLETRLIGRRRLIVYKSLLAFAKRDHPGPLAGEFAARPGPEPVEGGSEPAEPR